MENGSVTKKLEIRTAKECKTCEEAIAQLSPVAIANDIPIEVLPAIKSDEFLPVICFVDEGDVVIHRTCIKGYSNGVVELFKGFINE